MSDVWQEFVLAMRDVSKKYNPDINPTEANKLVRRIMSKYDTKEEYLAVQKDAIAFLNSDASLDDKRYVRGHMESLYMVISAFDQDR